MQKQNVKKKSRKRARGQCRKLIKMPAKIAASIPQSITNFEYSRGLQPTQTCSGAKHEDKNSIE